MTDQPLPSPGRQNVTPMARSLFLAMLQGREAKGITVYGRTLSTHNGRDAFLDAMEELIDGWQYLVQARMEHADLIEENARLRAEIAALKGEPS